MSTQNIVPRVHLSGSIGTLSKYWGTGSFGQLNVIDPIQGTFSGTATLTGSFTGSFGGDGSALSGVVSVASPAGPDTAIQFRNGVITSGSSNFTYDKTTNVVSMQCGVSTKNTLVTGSSYTCKQDDHRIRVRYTLTGSVNIKLPPAASVGNIEYKIKDEEGNASNNNIHLLTSGSNYIDGQLSQSLSANYISVSLYNDGVSNWYIE